MLLSSPMDPLHPSSPSFVTSGKLGAAASIIILGFNQPKLSCLLQGDYHVVTISYGLAFPFLFSQDSAKGAGQERND